MYHIIYDLEPCFDTLQGAQHYVDSLNILTPRIPYTAGVPEDTSIARLCVAPTPELCITGIGAGGRFRRCIDTRYDNADEIYPCIVCKVDGDFFAPGVDLVPDVELTQEQWSLSPARVLSAELRWLGSDSLAIEIKGATELVTAIHWVEPSSSLHHPWLDGKGHPLDCSDKGTEPWPPIGPVWDSLYYETFMGQKLVTIQPQLPPSGYCTCTPLDGGEPYRARLSNCRKFTGFFDKSCVPLFQGDICFVEGRIGEIEFRDNATLGIVCGAERTVTPFAALQGLHKRVLPGVASGEHYNIVAPVWLQFPNL